MIALLLAAAMAPVFHPLAIRDITSDNPVAWRHLRSHLEVTGFVTYKATEADGDEHLRICDSPKVTTMDRKRCLVAECIPALPCHHVPAVGKKVLVRGIYRFDGEHGHGWAEVHPVLFLEKVPHG